MDPATLIGVGLAFAAILASMVLEGGNPMSIMLIPPMVLVFFGTFGVGMAGGMLGDTLGSLKAMQRAFLGPKPGGGENIEQFVTLAERARREGLLALEEAARTIEDPFLRKGLELAVDGTDPEEVREILEAEIAAKRSTDKAHAKLFADMGGYAPTIGIIGTVLGLVHVLENLSQPDKLGHSIAVAFVATLWGVLTANVMWLPIGNKLKRLSELECQQMEMVIEGVMAIQAGANPRIIEQKLLALLSPAQRQAAEQAKAA